MPDAADNTLALSPADKAAMICLGNEVYGVGAVQKSYAARLPNLTFVCMGEGALYDWLRKQGVNVSIVPGDTHFVAGGSASTLMRMPAALKRSRDTAHHLTDHLESRGIQIVHTHWLSSQMVSGFMRSRGFRTVWHIHNNMSPDRLWGLGRKLNHALARWGADAIVPVSHFIGQNWRDSGVPIHMIHNGVDPVFQTLRPLPTSPMRCIAAGRLHPQKGHHIAVDAVLKCLAAGADIELDIFGGPIENNDYLQQMQQRIDLAGQQHRIRFRGFEANLRQRHQDYHLGLQCRIDPEPCSIWVCETLLDGLPLLASRSGGTPELVEDGVTGLLYEPGDVDMLAQQLLTLNQAPQRLDTMRRAAFERGRSQFTFDRVCQQTLELYRQLLSPATAPRPTE